jgi:hypothetical protein
MLGLGLKIRGDELVMGSRLFQGFRPVWGQALLRAASRLS